MGPRLQSLEQSSFLADAGFGESIRKSGLAGRLDEGRFLKLKKEVDKLLDPGQDRVRYYFLCRRCRTAVEVSGWGTVREEEDVVTV